MLYSQRRPPYGGNARPARVRPRLSVGILVPLESCEGIMQAESDGRSRSADVVSARVSSTALPVAERLVQEHYGLKAAARRLSSERDENFLMSVADGPSFLLKLTNSAEDRQVTYFQTGALLHVAATDPGFPVPHLVPSRNGAVSPVVATPDEPPRVMRLLDYLVGEPLHTSARSATQAQNLGVMLARLDLALRGYSHPGQEHELRWDLSHAATLRPLLEAIADPARRALATGFLDRFERYALPLLPIMRTQVIHNDFQPSNILVDAVDADLIVGVIDFGDMVRAPLICDLAVASAYHVATAPEPLDFVVAMLMSYHRVLPLTAEELDVFFDLVATRLVLTAVITNWRVTLHPGNSAYILRNAPAAWRGLERLAEVRRDDARMLFRRVCQLESSGCP